MILIEIELVCLITPSKYSIPENDRETGPEVVGVLLSSNVVKLTTFKTVVPVGNTPDPETTFTNIPSTILEVDATVISAVVLLSVVVIPSIKLSSYSPPGYLLKENIWDVAIKVVLNR